MELSQPVLLCTIPTNVMAHEVAQWLADQGIACQVIEGSDPLGGVENARIMVSVEDHPRGIQALQSIQRPAPRPAPTVEVPLRASMIDVKCERCGVMTSRLSADRVPPGMMLDSGEMTLTRTEL
mgnify:CR=1 FL=1